MSLCPYISRKRINKIDGRHLGDTRHYNLIDVTGKMAKACYTSSESTNLKIRYLGMVLAQYASHLQPFEGFRKIETAKPNSDGVQFKSISQ